MVSIQIFSLRKWVDLFRQNYGLWNLKHYTIPGNAYMIWQNP